MKKTRIPRKVWILWIQGRSEFPHIVEKCVASWVEENPSWEIILLDKDNLSEYIKFGLTHGKLSQMPLEKQANLIRLQLLEEYGGVWADATTLCMRPLDTWIDEASTSGFFAFHRPGPDRLMSNWFMACQKKCPIIVRMRERYVSFFSENKFNNLGYKKNIIDKLGKLFNQSDKTTKFWFSPLVTKFLRVHPYYIFHYIFERIVKKDDKCREIWNNTTKISADGPHRIKRLGQLSPINEEIAAEIRQKRVPIYKLDWRYNHGNYTPSTILHFLLEERNKA